ncbi:MAG TPA: sulfurtransferase TusA family protein [Dehalococcoidales bacterium]|nr:sulfurtransferase TusA family protein [Dehalococcoidales bacterium]
MSEITIIDARGLSCPHPVMLTNQAVKKLGKGSLEVLVDSGTARDNVSRFAQKNGWSVKIEDSSGSFYRVVLQK